jgi:effector-binding domain-containing protein
MTRVTEVHVGKVPPVTVAVVRGQAPQAQLPSAIPAACGEVWEYARSARLSMPGRHVAIYFDASVSYECGVEVGAPFTGADRVVCSSTPGGWAARVTLIGPYAGLPAAHRTILDWSSSTGRTLAGTSWEVYGHWTDDESRLRTDIYYLLAEPNPGAAD